MKKRELWPLLFLLAAAGYLALSWQRYARLGATVFDLGIHYQTVWLLGRGLDPQLTTRGLHAFADHFNPIAGAFGLLTRLWPSAVALLAAQAVLLAAASLPLYALARRGLSPALAAGACLVLLLQPSVLWLNRFDFHFAVVMLPASLAAGWALEAGRPRAYAWSLLLMLASTESAGFTVLFLVPVAARLRGRRWAVLTALAGVAGLGLAAASLAHGSHGLPTQYASLYSQPADLSWRYLASCLAGFLALPLVSPLRALPALPVLAGNLLSWRLGQHTLQLHYEAAVVGFLAWASVAALRSLARPRLVAGLLLLNLAVVLWLGEDYWRQPAAPLPQAPAGWAGVEAMLPAGASVSADNFAGARLAGRPHLFLFPNPFYPEAWGNRPQALVEQVPLTRPGTPGELRRGLDAAEVDSVVLLSPDFGFPEREPDRWVSRYALLSSRRYGAVEAEGVWLVLRRGEKWTDRRDGLLFRGF